jgi:uncharacterized protein YbbC (DUF1343 family)
MNRWPFLVALLVGSSPGPSRAPVRTGLEVLLSDSLQLVRGRSVGLVTNRAAIDRAGVPAAVRLRAAGVRLVALFSPEHGFSGTAAPGETVTSSTDSATGLPIYSLYGRTSAPSDSMLEGIDVLLVDLPDVGARYYTYLSTTIEVMRAAARRHLPVVVLDRPDPIGGAVQGNVLDTAYRSFIGALAVPARPGLTLGELARLANADRAIGADLVVVPAAGWRRSDDLYATGLPFVAPSPNLKDRESLWHYPGTCLFEGTALSVGRGTDWPYHQVGAPWLDTARVLRLVRRARPAGVRFEGVSFRPVAPGDGKHADRTVAGIRLYVTDRSRYDPTRTAVLLLAAVLAVHPDEIGFNQTQFDRLAGGPTLRQALLDRVPVGRIVASWKPDQERFLARRKPYLLYSER